MGVYDTYGDIQLKVGDVSMRYFKIGDEVDIPDGVYFTHLGEAVVIKDCLLIEATRHIFDKYGERVEA